MLVNLGGACLKERLKAQFPDENSDSFYRKVTAPLERYGFVRADRYSLKATQDGKNYVAEYFGQTESAPQPYVGEIALPRVAQPHKPLNFAKLYGGGCRRDGADDHREIPSLMAGQRIQRDSK
ncbi:MAG: hypothetical protein P4L87_11750 [Formivibrio sp.]|nr:hypothetical protein [Formivibrio sp.]